MKVLIVDDMKSNIGVITLLITEWCESNNKKIKISSALNGQIALDMVQENNYSIVFMDIMMPVMDGLESLSHIRKLSLKKQPVVIIQTALGDKYTKEKAKNLGANAYITKPVKYEMIDSMLTRYVSNTQNNNEFVNYEEIEKNTVSLDNNDETMEQLTVEEFLEDYTETEELLDELNDIGTDFIIVIESLENSHTKDNIVSLTNILSKYGTILNNFVEFYELCIDISTFTTSIKNIEIELLNKKEQQNIIKYFLTIIDEIQNWKEHVFSLQDASNVLYLNKIMPLKVPKL